MNDTYFVITCSEDGDIRVYEYTKQQLQAELVEEGSGLDTASFKDSLGDRDYDPQYWDGEALIIKGKIVTPREKTKVTEYELP